MEEKKWYQFTNDPRRGVWITKTDIEILELLFHNQFVTLKQLYRYGETLLDCKPDTLQKKLKRWEKYKIVVNKRLLVLDRPSLAYFGLGPNGEYILKNEKNLFEDIKREFYVPRGNLNHYFATQDVTINTFIQLREERRKVKSIHPSIKTYTTTMNVEHQSTIMVPDWLFETDIKKLNIELDTGNQQLSTIEEKINKYQLLSSLYPNEQHYVLFVVADNSFIYQKKYSDDRSKRVVSIKDTIKNINASKFRNLHMYVSSMTRSSNVASKILSNQYHMTKDMRNNDINLMSLLIKKGNEHVDLIPLNAKDFYLSDVDPSLYADGHFLVKGLNPYSDETYLFTILQEGSVEDFDRVTYLNTLQEEGRFKRPVDKIIAFYKSTMELENDVMGKALPHILFTQINFWLNHKGNSPVLYKASSPFRKEEVLLIEG